MPDLTARANIESRRDVVLRLLRKNKAHGASTSEIAAKMNATGWATTPATTREDLLALREEGTVLPGTKGASHWCAAEFAGQVFDSASARESIPTGDPHNREHAASVRAAHAFERLEATVASLRAELSNTGACTDGRRALVQVAIEVSELLAVRDDFRLARGAGVENNG